MAKERKKRTLTGVFNNVMGEASPGQESQEEKQVEKAPEKAPEPEIEVGDQDKFQQEEDGVISQFKKKKKKKRVEDTHTRVTFLVRNDLKAEIDRLFKKQGYGFKTFFINTAIEAQLEKIREEEEKNKKK